MCHAGRGGFGLFQGFADVLNVRIQAPFNLRVERKINEHGLKRLEGRLAAQVRPDTHIVHIIRP